MKPGVWLPWAHECGIRTVQASGKIQPMCSFNEKAHPALTAR